MYSIQMKDLVATFYYQQGNNNKNTHSDDIHNTHSHVIHVWIYILLFHFEINDRRSIFEP